MKESASSNRATLYFISIVAAGLGYMAYKLMAYRVLVQDLEEFLTASQRLTEEALRQELLSISQELEEPTIFGILPAQSIVQVLSSHLKREDGLSDQTLALIMHLMTKLAKYDEHGTAILQNEHLGHILVNQFLKHPKKTTVNYNEKEAAEMFEKKRKQALLMLESLLSRDRMLSTVGYEGCVRSFVIPLCEYLSEQVNDQRPGYKESRERVANCLLLICQNMHVQRCDLSMPSDQSIAHHLSLYLKKSGSTSDPIRWIIEESHDFLTTSKQVILHNPKLPLFHDNDLMHDVVAIAAATCTSFYTYFRWSKRGAPRVYARYNAMLCAFALIAIGGMEVVGDMISRGDKMREKTVQSRIFGKFDDSLPAKYKEILLNDKRFASGLSMPQDAVFQPIRFNEMVPVAQAICFAIACYQIKYFVVPMVCLQSFLFAAKAVSMLDELEFDNE